MCGEQASKKRYVGVPGMNSICKALASSPGITPSILPPGRSSEKLQCMYSDIEWAVIDKI